MQSDQWRDLWSCRICGSGNLDRFLSLGEVPLVNALPQSARDAAGAETFPLDVQRCVACSHMQLTGYLEPEVVFRDYAYVSGYAETVVAHGGSLARHYVGSGLLAERPLVAELASNDGAVLRAFQPHARVIGIDPARNVAAIANANGVPTVAEFFGQALVPRLLAEHGRPRLVIARNVLAHVPALSDFVAGVAHWLAPGGVFHVEVPYVTEMLRTTAFDTIYHEHLSYFSISDIDHLMRAAGLELFDVELIGLHGGSLLLRSSQSGAHDQSPRLQHCLGQETRLGLRDGAVHRRFAADVDRLRVELPRFLTELRTRGARIGAYGAAAKGVVLANVCGLGTDLIELVADRSPHKQGRWIPGTCIPIVSPEQMLATPPDYLVVFAWNFFDEIAEQLRPFTRAGGRFILPIPTPHVVEERKEVTR